MENYSQNSLLKLDTEDQILLNEFINKIKHLNDEFTDNLFVSEDLDLNVIFEKLYQCIKESINFKKKSFYYINRNCMNQVKENNYINELEIKMNNLVDQVNKYISQKENNNNIKELTVFTNKYENRNVFEEGDDESDNKTENLIKKLSIYKSELESNKIEIDRLKKDLRNQIFLSDDKDFVLSDLEKELSQVNQENVILKNEIYNIKLEQNQNKKRISAKLVQLLEEKNDLVLQNNKLLDENRNMKSNIQYTIDELKEIKQELIKFQKPNTEIKKNIYDSVILNYLQLKNQ